MISRFAAAALGFVAAATLSSIHFPSVRDREIKILERSGEIKPGQTLLTCFMPLNGDGKGLACLSTEETLP